MRIHPLLCSAILSLALIAGCQPEEPKQTIAPTPPPTAPLPAVPPTTPATPAPQTGTPAPGSTDADRNVGKAIDDATITAKVKAVLLQASEITGTDVNVDTVKGTVTLKGAVETQMQGDRAVQIARAAEGVREVNNQLMVRAKP